MRTLKRCIVQSVMLITAVLGIHAGGHDSGVKSGHGMGEEDRVFYVFDASNGLADNSAQIVRCTYTGRIMITTLGHVNFYDGSGFSHVDPLPSNIFPLKGYDGRYQLYFDNMHHLWIKNERQMACVNLTTERFFNDVKPVFQEMGVKGEVEDFFGDGEVNVWFQTGRQIYSPGTKKTFQIHSPSKLLDVDLYQDSLLLMFHADGSVVVNDYKTGKVLHQDHAFVEEERDRFNKTSELCLVGHRYYQLHNGEQESVMMCYDVDTHEWSRIFEEPIHMNALYPLEELLYIGTQRGYIVYNTSTGEHRHYETLTLSKGRTQVADINSLCFDRQGGLWIGTRQRGLLYCKAFTSPFKTFRIDTSEAKQYQRLLDTQTAGDTQLPHKINCVFTDSRGWTWTGSYNGVLLKQKDGTMRVFGRKDGMTNDVVHSIAEDQQHDIWVSTSFGICHFFIRDNEVYHVEPYVNQDNVPNEMFVNGRAMTLKDGTIIMESLDHITTFNPAAFHAKQFGNLSINPKLVHLAVNGNNIECDKELDDQVIIDKAVSRVADISVNYNQNSVLMLFSGLNYLRPIQTYYRVRVKGVPAFDDWRILSYGRSDGMVDKSGQLRLALLGLEPGDYRVEVQTSMWPETWKEEPYVWNIHVKQPWWRSTGMYFALGVLVLIFIIFNFWLFNHNMQLRMVLNNEEYDIMRHIKTFASRCKALEGEMEEMPAEAENDKKSLEMMNREFVEAMTHIVPYVNENAGRDFQMDRLAEVAGIEKTKLYELLSNNIDKSPRLYLAALRQLKKNVK